MILMLSTLLEAIFSLPSPFSQQVFSIIQLLKTHSIFKEAIKRKDPNIYISKCVYDLSIMSNATDVRCDVCNSASIAQYTSVSELSGLCIPWRSTFNCSSMEFVRMNISSISYPFSSNLNHKLWVTLAVLICSDLIPCSLQL